MNLKEAIYKALDIAGKAVSVTEVTQAIKDSDLYETSSGVPVHTHLVENYIKNNKAFTVKGGKVLKNEDFFDRSYWDLLDQLRGEFTRDSYGLFIVILFYFRYKGIYEGLPKTSVNALYWLIESVESTLKKIKQEKDLDEVDLFNPLMGLLFESSGEKIYDGPAEFIKTKKFHWEDRTSLLQKFYQILSRYDWSIEQISAKEFDKFLRKLLEGFINKGSYGKQTYDTQSPLKKLPTGNILVPTQFPELLSKITEFKEGDRICDLNSTLGELFIQDNLPSQPVDLLIYHYDPEILFYSFLRLFLFGMNNIELHKNIFTAITEGDYNKLMMMPPFGSFSRKEKEEISDKFEGKLEASSNEEFYLKLGINGLESDGIAYFFIPDGILFRSNSSLKEFRKKLVQKRWLKTVVSLPKGILSPYTGVNVSLLIVEKKNSEELPFYVDYRSEVEGWSQNKPNPDLNKLSTLLNQKKEEKRISRFVDWDEFAEAEYDLSLNKYFNPKIYQEQYLRNANESLFDLSEKVERVRLNREEVTDKFPILNMEDLADDPANYTIDVDSLPTKSDYKSRLEVLAQDAVLIGKIGNYLKPSLFRYQGQPVFVGGNVIALKPIPGEELDKEYLISELNSEFVADQLEKIPKGTYIPNIKLSDLLHIYIRVPNDLNKQISHFNDWIKGLAKAKVEEVKSISSKLRLVEKDYLSGFKHDFMQILSSLSSGLKNIENFTKSLAEKGEISLDDPVAPIFPGEEKDEQNSIGKTLERVHYNIQSAIDFLEVEMDRITSGVNNKDYETVKLFNYLEKEWLKTVGHNRNYSVIIEKNTDWPSNDLSVSIVPSLFNTILRNLLNNAIRHGFVENKSDYEFIITLGIAEEKGKAYAKLLIYNNGKPFPENYTFENFITARTSAGKNRGTGLGGSQILRLINELNGIFQEPKNPVSEKIYPVQFEILLPIK